MNVNIAAILYLIAGILFILALRGLSSPATSRQGNRFGMIGMGLAILTTLAYRPPSGLASWIMVIAGIAIGGAIGAWRARTVKMTDMPQLIAFFHALVGLCSSRPARSMPRRPSASASPVKSTAAASWKCRLASPSARSPSPARSSPF